MEQKGLIYLVATPIGNLGDFSFRAVEVLKAVDLIACEDTRHSRILLDYYGISKKLVSLREHNENEQADRLVAAALAGQTVAYLSDAGTPLVSDPGGRLVEKALSAGLIVEALPGPAALIQALVLSGLPADNFKFCGFLPAKKSERMAALHDVKDETATLIFYEAPHRIKESLVDILKVFGDRSMAAGRELTKKFEETLRGKASELLEHFQKTEPRGEFTLVVTGAPVREKTAEISEGKISFLAEKLVSLKISEKEIIQILKEVFDLPRNTAYQLVLKVKKSIGQSSGCTPDN